MEEIIINESELKEVARCRGYRPNKPRIPMASVARHHISFNAEARYMIGNAIRWYTTSEYVIGLPCNPDDKNGFKVHDIKNGTGQTTTFPAELRNAKKIVPGQYKLEPYKNGFVFRRYKPFKLATVK